MVKAIYFDLFFTLIVPAYEERDNEYDILNLSVGEWEQSPLFKYFNDAIFSCNVGLLKPDKQIYELALQRLNVSPEECLFVGDGGSNELCGAKSAGLISFFYDRIEILSRIKRQGIISKDSENQQQSNWVLK